MAIVSDYLSIRQPTLSILIWLLHSIKSVSTIIISQLISTLWNWNCLNYNFALFSFVIRVDIVFSKNSFSVFLVRRIKLSAVLQTSWLSWSKQSLGKLYLVNQALRTYTKQWRQLFYYQWNLLGSNFKEQFEALSEMSRKQSVWPLTMI